MSTIITHCNVDLDACASVWAVEKFVPGYYRDTHVSFVPANWRGTEGVDHTDPEGEALAVDISAGIKGLNNCAFAKILWQWAPAEAQKALNPLVRYITAQDQTGCAEAELLGEDGRFMAAYGLNAVLNSLRRCYRNDDVRIVKAMGDIFDGWYEGAEERIQAIPIAEEAARAATARGLAHVVVVPDGAPAGVNGILYDMGAKALVFQDGNNIGVIRSNKETFHLGDILRESGILPDGEEWFSHPAGFLVAHGTRKAPATEHTSVDALSLARVVDDAISTLILSECLDRR